MKTKTLCIIDDDDLYKLLLEKSIHRLQIDTNIITYANGKDALIGLTNFNSNAESLPDIILLDINMPVMDGWEFMEHFLALKNKLAKNIIIYIASSSIASQDIEKSKSYKEISGYLIKPIYKETIKSLLKETTLM